MQLALAACDEFIKRFETDGKPPDRVEESQERGLQCHFNKARRGVETPEALGGSLKEYEFLTSYLGRNKVEGMESELQWRGDGRAAAHKMKNAIRAAGRA